MLAEIRVESAEKLRNFNTHRRNFGLHSLNVDLHVFSLRTCLLICFISCVTRILRVCKHSSSEFTRTPCSTLANNFRGLIFGARSVCRCSFVALQICKWNCFGFFFFLNDWTLTFLVLQKKEIRRIITMMNEKNLLRWTVIVFVKDYRIKKAR